MRIKTILSLIAFSATFISSVLLIGLPQNNFYAKFNQARVYSQNRHNIRMLLWQDINNGRARNQELMNLDGIDEEIQSQSNIIQIAGLTEEYVDASQSIDASGLPADFQAAWQAHMNAWRVQADYLNQLKMTADKYPVNQKTGRYLFNLNSNNTYGNQTDEINQTWFKVLQIGRKYGVYVPVE